MATKTLGTLLDQWIGKACAQGNYALVPTLGHAAGLYVQGLVWPHSLGQATGLFQAGSPLVPHEPLYQVLIDRADHTKDACTGQACRQGQAMDGNACKHVWAARMVWCLGAYTREEEGVGQ